MARFRPRLGQRFQTPASELKMAELTDALLDELEGLASAGTQGPWKSMVEGRDHVSGDSFIKVGAGDARREDIYVFRERRFADGADLDLIAAARSYLHDLVAEVKRLRLLLKGGG